MNLFIAAIFISVVIAEQQGGFHDYHNSRYDARSHESDAISPTPGKIVSIEQGNDEDSPPSHEVNTGRGSRVYRHEEVENDGSYDGSLVDTIPGKAGKDYPAYTEVPKTGFSCEGRTPSGYFADVETDCQVFHICLEGGQKISFLCPNGSIFNQKVSVCDWWYDVDCSDSPEIVDFTNDIQRDQIYHDPNYQFQHFIVEETYDLNLASSGGNQNPKFENKQNEEMAIGIKEQEKSSNTQDTLNRKKYTRKKHSESNVSTVSSNKSNSDAIDQ